jgi:hypothetical protein
LDLPRSSLPVMTRRMGVNAIVFSLADVVVAAIE